MDTTSPQIRLASDSLRAMIDKSYYDVLYSTPAPAQFNPQQIADRIFNILGSSNLPDDADAWVLPYWEKVAAAFFLGSATPASTNGYAAQVDVAHILAAKDKASKARNQELVDAIEEFNDSCAIDFSEKITADDISARYEILHKLSQIADELGMDLVAEHPEFDSYEYNDLKEIMDILDSFEEAYYEIVIMPRHEFPDYLKDRWESSNIEHEIAVEVNFLPAIDWQRTAELMTYETNFKTIRISTGTVLLIFPESL